MNIIQILCNKSELRANLIERIVADFDIDQNYLEQLYDNSIGVHIGQLLDDITIFIESPYTDKVYRDSYYTYFSSKLGMYKKECIRLSFFTGTIDPTSFDSESGISTLQSQYLGFMVIRPTLPNLLGRSVISPKGFKNNNFLYLCTTIDATVNFVKFEVEGFPHSSQDTETITCAETTLWATMEYFGYKYSEYKPVLPSKIIEVLKKVSAERQVPSKGLNIQQMAFALKEFGFGTKVYARDVFGKDDFKKLFSTYIESGIPIITALENRMYNGNIGHAILTIGHEKVSPDMIDNLLPAIESNKDVAKIINNKSISFYDYDDIDKKFVFIDDNMPVYQQGKFETPVIHYTDAAWHNCEITYFIVPLYTKIYLEAFEAKSFFKRFILDYFPIIDKSEMLIRFYLASSRSYKHYLKTISNINDPIKSLILEKALPKFIWIGEISDKTTFKNEQAIGLVILDATEANILTLKSLVAAAHLGEFISLDPVSKWYKKNALPLQPFNIFTGNLKGI